MQVRVFRNLAPQYKGKAPVYSIQAQFHGGKDGRKGWFTIAHASHVSLTDVAFNVSAAGVRRIRATGKKAVVATVHGTLAGWDGTPRIGPLALERHALEDRRSPDATQPDPVRTPSAATVRFNPKQMDHFQIAATGDDVTQAGAAWIGQRGVIVSRWQ